MCGIVGFTGKKNKILLDKLLKTIRHRGYDETSYFFYPGINLGLNRFAINDLRTGLYPMTYKDYVLVFNGEIYNSPELKSGLQKKGILFKTGCDAEVILPLFDKYQDRAFSILEGMFAISIFDKKTKRLILARDKSGEKPLYYQKDEGGFIFASELKTILAVKNKGRKLNLNAISSYLHHGSAFGENTLAQKINKIPPSHFVVFDLKSKLLTLKQYWQPQINQTLGKMRPDYLETQLAKLIKVSVEKRLLADVPVGSFLSGGVDSSLITYFASRKIDRLKTYSISFPGSLKHDEAAFARKVASLLKTEHTEIDCSAKKLIPVIEELGKYIDEPIVDPAVLPTFFLAREARRSVKVVLTGEGADELFGGYYRYHKRLMAQKLSRYKKYVHQFLPNRFKKIFTPLFVNYSPQSVWTDEEINRLLRIDIPKISIPPHIKSLVGKNPLLAMQLYDYRGYLAEQLLMKVDKTTMIHNLESRAPYLDTEIINFAFSLPSGYKVRGIHGKYILKKVAEKYLPKTVVWRPKHGFSLPLNTWFRGPWKDVGEKSLEELKPYHKIFNLDYYGEVLNNHMKRQADYGNKIFSMVALAKWLTYHKIKI